MAYEHEKELADAYNAEVMDSAIDAHLEAWPDGCPSSCHYCESRLRDRCGDVGHFWPADFTYGDTCYCGALYLLQDEHGRVNVKETT